MTSLVLSTEMGVIHLDLLSEAAPLTVAHVTRLVQNQALYDGSQFYRSDFVIQFGLHGTDKKGDALNVNETHTGSFLSNLKGTMSVAHFDVPDCGGSEFFLNMQDNPHLDNTYGGYCVFARIRDGSSMETAEAIADTVKSRGKVKIHTVRVL